LYIVFVLSPRASLLFSLFLVVVIDVEA